MIERIEGMPPGTVGLRASGKLSKADYTEVLEPALREGSEELGRRLRSAAARRRGDGGRGGAAGSLRRP